MATIKSRILGLSAGEINGSKRTLPAIKTQQVSNAVNRVAAQPVTKGTQTTQVNNVPVMQNGQVNSSIVNKLVMEALNKRIQAKNMGMQAPIKEAITATAQYYDPKSQYKNMGATGLDTLAQMQQGGQNRANQRAQSLLNLYSAFGNQTTNNLNSMEGIYAQQNQAAQLEAQQKQQEEALKLQQQQQNWNQQYQGGQLTLAQQQAQQQAAQEDWNKQYQQQQLNQNQAAQDWQQKYQQGTLDVSQANTAADQYTALANSQRDYDKAYLDAYTAAPKDQFGQIDAAYQQQLDQLKAMTSFADPEKPTDEYWANGQRKVRREASQPVTIPGVPVANAASGTVPGGVNQEYYDKITSVPVGSDSPAGWINQYIQAGVRDPQEIIDGLASEQVGLTPSEFRQVQGLLSATWGQVYTPSEQKTAGQEANEAYSAEKTKITIKTIDRAMSSINEYNTGAYGRAQALIPGTAAYELNQDLITIGSAIFANELKAMKQQSATGSAGTGGMSNIEGEMLRHAMGSLDIGLPPERLKANLQDVKDSISQFKAKAEKNMVTTTADPLQLG
jgi:hypothetical protein